MLSKWRYRWVKLDPGQHGKVVTLELYQPKMIRVEDYRICVVRLEDGVFGINNVCPHAGAALHAGFCNKNGVITCPMHNYKFNMRDGNSADGNNYKAYSFQFEEREEGWFIGIKKF